MEAFNRKLIRPSLAEIKQKLATEKKNNQPKKQPPPDRTYAENFYYAKQIQHRTPMVLVLVDGETVEGVIEWYDKNCLKLQREGKPNLLIYKSSIKYMYKAQQATKQAS